jgi:hypothetical protein
VGGNGDPFVIFGGATNSAQRPKPAAESMEVGGAIETAAEPIAPPETDDHTAVCIKVSVNHSVAYAPPAPPAAAAGCTPPCASPSAEPADAPDGPGATFTPQPARRRPAPGNPKVKKMQERTKRLNRLRGMSDADLERERWKLAGKAAKLPDGKQRALLLSQVEDVDAEIGRRREAGIAAMVAAAPPPAVAPASAESSVGLPVGWFLVRCDHDGNPSQYGQFWKALSDDGEETDVSAYPDDVHRWACRLAQRIAVCAD